MKVGLFKYNVVVQDQQKIEAQAPQGKTGTSQFVLMSANLFRSSQGGLDGVDPTKGNDCPFYMMDSENEGSCPSNNTCPQFLCDMDV